MPELKPFKAVRYNEDKIEAVSSVVAPPYDVIPPAMQDDLYRSSKYNVVRLILGKIEPDDNDSNNRYTRAAGFLEAWLKENVLIQADRPAIYIYSQTYRLGSKHIDRIGFIGLMGIDTGKGDKVLPHENTLHAPKVDRLNLIRKVQANLSPIFVLYEDNKHTLVNMMKRFCASNKPVIDVKYEGIRNRVWAMEDESLIARIRKYIDRKAIFIADGHHRFEVARTYAAEARNSGLPEAIKSDAQYVMVYFAEVDERTLTVLPTHRVLKDIGSLTEGEILERLRGSFVMKKSKNLRQMMAGLAKLPGEHAFGMRLGKAGFYVLKLKNTRLSDKAIQGHSKQWRRLDVSILHLFVFQKLLGVRDDDDNVEFFKDPADASRLVDGGKRKLAFFLNPTRVSQVKEIAKLGERMPRKSTYFYPKPISGLVINKFGV